MAFHPTLSRYGRVLLWPVIKFAEFLGSHFPSLLVQIRYLFVFHKPLDLTAPDGLNEKILWAKLYSDTSKWVDLADKLKVRDYIKETGLGDTLVKLYAVWYKIEDVNFDNLPDTFIIKANNGDGKGTNKIIRKSDLNINAKYDILGTIKEWLSKRNIGALSAEPHYKYISPCVVVEEVLPIPDDNTFLIDYKMWCFNGKCHYIFVCSNRSKRGDSVSIMTYDTQWNPHPEFTRVSSEYPRGSILPKPQNLDKMIETAELLAKGFPEVRVDLYNIEGRIYFGEMTFTSQGGFMNYFTEDFNYKAGSLFDTNDFPLKKK